MIPRRTGHRRKVGSRIRLFMPSHVRNKDMHRILKYQLQNSRLQPGIRNFVRKIVYGKMSFQYP